MVSFGQFLLPLKTCIEKIDKIEKFYVSSIFVVPKICRSSDKQSFVVCQ